MPRSSRRSTRTSARDKGFGPALGPAAAGLRLARFEALGYAVVQGTSDWVFGPEDRDMQDAICRRLGARRARDRRRCRVRDIATGWLARRDAAVAAGLLTARRSRRFLRGAERHALSRQIAVEQHFVADAMNPHRHAQRLVGALERRQRSGRGRRRRG